jgi:prevent-host-death family protein
VNDTVNIHEAKTHLSRLLQQVERGAVITIARAGTPVAMLVPVGRQVGGRRQVKETATLPRAFHLPDRGERLQRFLEEEVWPHIPPEELGRRLTRAEEDAILGYGPDGV